MEFVQRNRDFDLFLMVYQGRPVNPNEQIKEKKRTLVDKINAFEKILIAQELTRTKGNVKETCLNLGLPRKTFYDKMKKHSLKRQDFLEPKPSHNRSASHG